MVLELELGLWLPHEEELEEKPSGYFNYGGDGDGSPNPVMDLELELELGLG